MTATHRQIAIREAAIKHRGEVERLQAVNTDLLAALKTLHREANASGPPALLRALQEARAAIAKAEQGA